MTRKRHISFRDLPASLTSMQPRHARLILKVVGLWIFSMGILAYDSLNLDSALFVTLLVAIFGFILKLNSDVVAQHSRLQEAMKKIDYIFDRLMGRKLGKMEKSGKI